MKRYITEHDTQLLFESWLEADYPNEKDGYPAYVGKLDHGEPYQQLTDSYANSYIPMNDSDKDGLWDFVENQIVSNINVLDTDGDGVPDSSELLDDRTNPVDATEYKVTPSRLKVPPFMEASRIPSKGLHRRPSIKILRMGLARSKSHLSKQATRL